MKDRTKKVKVPGINPGTIIFDYLMSEMPVYSFIVVANFS